MYGIAPNWQVSSRQHLCHLGSSHVTPCHPMLCLLPFQKAATPDNTERNSNPNHKTDRLYVTLKPFHQSLLFLKVVLFPQKWSGPPLFCQVRAHSSQDSTAVRTIFPRCGAGSGSMPRGASRGRPRLARPGTRPSRGSQAVQQCVSAVRWAGWLRSIIYGFFCRTIAYFYFRF